MKVNIDNIPNLLTTDKEQLITAKKTFDDVKGLLTLGFDGNHRVMNFSNTPAVYLWNNGTVGNITYATIVEGFQFQWGEQFYVMGIIRGGSYSSDYGFGIGKLDPANQNIIPILRITENGLYFMEKRITT